MELLELILSIFKELGPENNVILVVILMAFIVVGFALYVLLAALNKIPNKEQQNG